MQELKMEDVINFVKTNWLRIVLKGAISFAFVIVALALSFAIAPRSESYRSEIQVTLESREGSRVYPNGDKFGLHDIISAPVLTRVWSKYGFDKQGVKFEDFSSWFSIVGYDKERAKIDAEFQGMMAKRNITATELASVQAQYEAKLAALADNRFALSLRPGKSIDRDTAVRILNDIPKLWFEAYATIKAPQIPAVASADSIRAYAKRSSESGGRALEMIDAIRDYIEELRGTCAYIREGVMRGRNAKCDGADLGAYESELSMLNAEVIRLKNNLLINGGEADLGGYVKARLDDMACEKLALEERINAVRQTIDLVSDKRANDVRQIATVSPTDATPVTLQADSGFFTDFTAMIRRDANQELVHKYAQELTELKKQMANLSARKLYYDQIVNYVNENVAAGRSAQASDATKQAMASFTNELLDLGEKVVAFRDNCLETYRTPDQFFVVASTPAFSKSFTFPIARFALAILALWALYNLISLLKLWNKNG